MTVIQYDLFGLPLGYSCKKCGKCFDTMKKSSAHHAHAHKKRSRKSVNFVLENYHMVVETVEVVAQ